MPPLFLIQYIDKPMSNDQPQESGADDLVVDERRLLMDRARVLGITFSNNIGTDTLREKIAAKMNEGSDVSQKEEPSKKSEEPEKVIEEEDYKLNPLVGETEKPVKVKTLRQHMIDEQMKLVRVRVTNMDPKKKDLKGEIFTVANEYLGTVKKFVPYGEATDEGYHIPYCIYNMLQRKRFQHIRVNKDPRTSQEVVSSVWAKEFALEVLPQLTRKELDNLASAQTAAGSVG